MVGCLFMGCNMWDKDSENLESNDSLLVGIWNLTNTQYFETIDAISGTKTLVEFELQPTTDYILFSGKPEIGKLIGNEEIRGKGIAFNATKVLLKFAFEELKIKDIYAITEFDNVANIHLNKKLGFTIIGEEERNGRIFIIMTLKNNLV